MDRVVWSACVAAAVVLSVAPARAQEREPLGVMKVDAVSLLGGTPRPGQEAFAAEHAGYRYLFADQDNLSLFLKNPEAYEIQMGGACARMGPLSGRGDTDIHAVQDGKLYIFASESCRQTFLKHHDKLLEADDPAPVTTPAGTREARRLLDLAVSALGGAERVDGVKTYAVEYREEVEQGGQKWVHDTARQAAFPDRFISNDAWNELWWAQVLTPAGGTFVSHDGERVEMVGAQARALEREFLHDPLVMLRRRHDDGFVCTLVGSDRLDGVEVSLVHVWHSGTGCVLAIDPASGRVLANAYQGRGKSLFLGRVEERYSDWREVNGLSLAFTRTLLFDGEPFGPARTASAIVIDAPPDPLLFAPAGQPAGAGPG